MALTAKQIHGFSESLLSKRYFERKGTPACHLEWWELCCSDHPLVAIAAPRGHAKSTAITHAYTLANLLFRERAFCLIVSDTYEQAVMFLKEIVSELQDNEELIAFFNINPDFEKDSENDIIVRFNDGGRFRIIAKGSEQKVRGLKWDGRRPDLIVCDDLENDEIVQNDERRKKFKDWFLDALVPCRSDNGIIRIVGTILHLDSLLETLMPPLHDKKYTVFEDLKSWSTNSKRAWRGVRYRAHPGIDDFSSILWESKWPKTRLLAERQKYLYTGNPACYAKEYLNYPIDESHAYFRRGDFLPMTDRDKEVSKHYYVGVDLALGESDRSDFSSFVVGGVDEDGMLHIVDVINERMDTMEAMETFFQLQLRYDPEVFVMEGAAIEKSIGPFLQAEMIKPNRVPLSIMKKTPSKDKDYRARSIQARMRAGGVKFDKNAEWYPRFERELVEFPSSKHDDMVDAFAYIGLALKDLVEAPTLKEQEEAAWEEEVNFHFGGSDALFGGRNRLTGY
jgi:predicted phage terminase large subunit-like protein